MKTPPDTPKTLLDQLARKGELEEAKWTEFDRLYRPVIRFFIRQKFHTLANDCEDIAQDVMMRLVELLRSRKYDSARAKFRTYLYAIVYNIAVDYLRSRKRAEALDLAELDWMGRTPPTGAEVMERQWKEACYEAARKHVLERVPLADGHREIYLEAEKGRKSAEIAAAHSVSPALVRQVKHRVSGMIREYMKHLSQNETPTV